MRRASAALMSITLIAAAWVSPVLAQSDQTDTDLASLFVDGALAAEPTTVK